MISSHGFDIVTDAANRIGNVALHVGVTVQAVVRGERIVHPLLRTGGQVWTKYKSVSEGREGFRYLPLPIHTSVPEQPERSGPSDGERDRSAGAAAVRSSCGYRSLRPQTPTDAGQCSIKRNRSLSRKMRNCLLVCYERRTPVTLPTANGNNRRGAETGKLF